MESLSYHRLATQITTADGNPAALAVDADLNTFSLTTKTSNPWLKVNLESTYTVTEVLLCNSFSDHGL